MLTFLQLTLNIVTVPFWDEKKSNTEDSRVESPNGPGPTAFLFGTEGRMCSRHSRTEHETRHITVLTRNLDTFKMT